MPSRARQTAISLAAMATIGSSYGWSITALVLQSAKSQSPVTSDRAFAGLVLGIGIGVGLSGFTIRVIGYRRTILLGMILWGASLLAAASIGFGGSIPLLWTTYGLPGGIGVGMAYLALVLIFREAFKDRPLLGGAIGPLGFTSGTIIFAIAQWSGFGTHANTIVHIALGITSIALGFTVTFLNLDPLKPECSSELVPSLRSGRFWRLWAILAINVAPGMATVAVGAIWLTNASGISPRSAVLRFASATPALTAGQLFWGYVASRFGDRVSFMAMFAIRFLAFLFAIWMPSHLDVWAIFVLVLSCHGGGFGLIPRIVRRILSGNDSRVLGLILTAWGIGGFLGVLLILPHTENSSIYSGINALTVLMLLGFLTTLGTNFSEDSERPAPAD
jgi:OFA family oxalate/formate antiporter-like MFS transporter